MLEAWCGHEFPSLVQSSFSIGTRFKERLVRFLPGVTVSSPDVGVCRLSGKKWSAERSRRMRRWYRGKKSSGRRERESVKREREVTGSGAESALTLLCLLALNDRVAVQITVIRFAKESWLQPLFLWILLNVIFSPPVLSSLSLLFSLTSLSLWFSGSDSRMPNVCLHLLSFPRSPLPSDSHHFFNFSLFPALALIS